MLKKNNLINKILLFLASYTLMISLILISFYLIEENLCRGQKEINLLAEGSLQKNLFIIKSKNNPALTSMTFSEECFERCRDEKRDAQKEDMTILSEFKQKKISQLKVNELNTLSIKKKNKVVHASSIQPIYRVFTATAYTPYCKGCTGITYTGIDVRKQTQKFKIVAVDPSIIELGSKIEILSEEGNHIGIYEAQDIGGAIKGFKIDILVQSYNEAINFGRKQVRVRIIN